MLPNAVFQWTTDSDKTFNTELAAAILVLLSLTLHDHPRIEYSRSLDVGPAPADLSRVLGGDVREGLRA